MKKTKLKVGDKVLNKPCGSIGIIAMLNPAGMNDCVLVRFNPASDGYCIPKKQLEKVED